MIFNINGPFYYIFEFLYVFGIDIDEFFLSGDFKMVEF